jgi:hypothetical protein
MITIENINKYGFVFHAFNPDEIFKETDEETIEALEDYVSSLIQMPNEHLVTDIDILKYGDDIPLHYHIIPGSFQVVVWAPTAPYKGRQYVYGTMDYLRFMQPGRGLMCFMKPNDPEFIHGVTMLQSTEPVKTYGITSTCIDLPDINDIYVNL